MSGKKCDKKETLPSSEATQMSNERIDLTQFEESFGSLLNAVLGGTCTLEDGEGHLHDRMQVILAELKKMYAREDQLLDALRIIRDDLDETIGKDTVLSLSSRLNMMRKIRNFANDASL